MKPANIFQRIWLRLHLWYFRQWRIEHYLENIMSTQAEIQAAIDADEEKADIVRATAALPQGTHPLEEAILTNSEKLKTFLSFGYSS